MTLNEIRKELKEIRYYYSRKNVFDKEVESIGVNSICKRIEVYNKIACLAPPRLFDLYITLYKENNTQESLADKLGYSSEHISRLNNELVRFFYKKINEMEGK